MKEESFRQTFQIPGTEQVLQVTRAASGQLLCLEGGGRVYISQQDDGRHFDNDLVIMSETLIGKTLLRQVKTSDSHWLERYVWGEDERLTEVDGVLFDRDEKQRIIASACPDGDSWSYRYSDDGPVAIAYPSGRRTLRWRDGVLTGLSENSRHQHFGYTEGIRDDAPTLPDSLHRDELGRIWCISAEDGSIATTFLWDGFACLGRIDGPPGKPLAAVYSLDPTCTPVRIITRDEVLRIPRDAFGEALLDYPGNPGLYGGLVWQGYTHLPSRSLDPRTGCFISPDSYDGLETDPRRESGFQGALFTEHETVNRYAISQYDAIGRADPTGNLSIWVYLSDFTWSLQNNLVGWFGLDWTVNLFGSLFSGQIGDFFDYEHLESSSRLGLTAVRRDGLMAPGRAWTFQHLVMVPKANLHVLAQARAIDPQAEFIPTLYGTVLIAEPAGRQPFLLLGTNFQNTGAWPNGPSDWTRSGGPARPVVQGSNIPYFPQGGLHLDQVIPQVPEPGDAVLRELEATERSITGSIDSRPVIVIDSASTGLAVDVQVLVTDAAGNIGIFRLLSVTTTSDTTRVRLDSDNPGLGPSDIRIRQLGPPDATETLSQTTLPTHLELQGSTGDYRLGNVLRMSQNNTEVGVSLVNSYEARLELDGAIPDPFDQPISVLMANVSGAPTTVQRTANASAVEYPAAIPLPGIGAALVVSGNSNSVPVIVLSLNAREVVMDRSLASTGNDGDDVNIQALVRGTELGNRNEDREPAALISYTPTAIRNAPDSGNLWLEDNSGRVAVRQIKSRIYDAIVTQQALPGNASNPYNVERFELSGFDGDGLNIDTEQVLALDENIDIGSPAALMIQELVRNASGTITTGVTDSAWSNNAGSVSKQFNLIDNPPNIGRPAEALVINDSTDTELRRIRTTRVTLQLDRSVTLTAGADAGLKAVAISTANQNYQGKVIGPLQFELPGHSLAIDDEATVSFSLSGANQTLEYRVTRIDAGNTLTLSGGQTHDIELTDSASAIIPGSVTGELFIAALPLVGSQPVQMPRLNSQATIELVWDNANVNLKVVEISGDSVTLTHRDAVNNIQDLYVKEISFQQMEPNDPTTGTVWAGINGRVVNGVAASTGLEQTTEVSFDVWTANAIPKGAMLAIADGDQTIPCRVEASSDMDVVITFDRDLDTSATSLDLAVPSIPQTGFAVDFVRQDRAIIIRDTPPLFAVSASHFVIVTPMIPAVEPIRLASGSQIGPGTVLVPEDPENWELDRRQSLIDHELIHTRQSAAWGPLLLAWFPLFALEGLYEGLTDIEEADFSAYVDAQLTTVNSTRLIGIPSPGGIEFSSGDSVQLFVNENLQTIRLGESPSDNAQQFAVTLADSIADQNLRLRKLLNDSAWATTRDVFFNIQQVLTHGGILNTLTGSVYGGLFHGIGRLFYAMGRAIFGKGERHAGTVISPDKTSITLSNQAGVTALQDVNRIIIQKDDLTIVRSVSTSISGSGDTLTLSSAVDFDGEVFLAPYTTHTPDSAWDWYSYYPAQVPNASEPAAIRLFEAADGDTLTLSAFDRVVVTSGESRNRTNVVLVRDDGIVELEEIPQVSGAQRNLRIAKIDEGDPIGNVDSIALRELGFGWMRWLFDPYGQFQYRLQPDNTSFWGIVARVARYLFGSTSWSLLPVFGYYFWDNLFVQIGNNGHFSQMEQEASQESGDLYSPIARLRGAFSKNSDNDRYQGVVGDIGRYWYFHGARNSTFIQTSQRDAPGTQFRDASSNDPLRVITDVIATGSLQGPPAPNANAAGGGTTPGLVLPDRLFYKNTPLLTTTTVTNPNAYAPGPLGFLPVSAFLERSLGMYVSFSRPGSHRITVVNGIVSAQNAIDVQEGNSTFGFGHQTIYFNIDIADVDVNVAGQAIASTLTDDGSGNFLPESIELVQLQRARVSVLPNAARRYAITVPHSGKGGHLLTNGANEIVALNRDTPSNTPEAVEITRLYQKNATGGYDDAVLNAHNGVHLTDDLHIPVRSFLVSVVNTLPVRRAVNLDTADVLDPNVSAGKLHPGDTVFVIIPVDPVNTLRLDTVTYPSNPAMVTHPSRPLIEAEPTPVALQTFIGDGVVSKVTLQADNPPETTARITLTVTAGYEELRADLKAEMEVIPHVTLQAVTVLTLQNNGSSIDLNSLDESNAAVNLLQDSIRLLEIDNTSANGLTALVSNSTVTITATASATLGRKQILVKKDSDEDHWARLTFEVIA